MAPVKCDKCSVRIPKNRPQLKCDNCEKIKHFKCNGLSKMEAFDIIQNHPYWTCQDCIFNILPINVAHNIKDVLEKCDACSLKIKGSSVVSTCPWCNGRCHKNCLNGQLGCTKCCSDTIPGFGQYAHDLLGETYLNSRPLFNPWDQEHIINQLGLRENFINEQPGLEEVSSKILHCEYSTLKSLPSSCDGSPRILSLNIRSLTKNIDKLKENILVLLEKCDIICLCETNLKFETLPDGLLKFESLPNGLNDITLNGFHDPILQSPYRKSGKGGGLAIYVNKSFCDSDAFSRMKIDDITMRKLVLIRTLQESSCLLK